MRDANWWGCGRKWTWIPVQDAGYAPILPRDLILAPVHILDLPKPVFISPLHAGLVFAIATGEVANMAGLIRWIRRMMGGLGIAA